MKSSHRAVIFWGVCIPLRTYLSTLGDVAFLRLFAAVIGYRWVRGYENGDEGVFGGPAWWADERVAHGTLWMAYAVTGNSNWLKSDVLLGALNWFSHINLTLD